MSADDLLVVQIAAAAALLVGLAGAALLRVMTDRSVAASFVVVALVGVGAVVAGALGTARAMFLSSHDFGVLLVVSLVSGSVALVAALLLGRGLVRRSRRVAEAAEQLDGTGYEGVDGELPSELARIDRALRAASARLAAARSLTEAQEHSRRELFGGLSHDLRTPLAGIRATAEALEDGVLADPEEVRRTGRLLRREADRMAAMVDDLFALARIDARAVVPARSPLQVADLVSDVLDAAGPLAVRGGVHLAGRVPDGLPAVRGAESDLGRVLQNLVGNAVQHTPSGGTVEVTAGADGAGVLLHVDDGCGGIPPADLPRLFEAGYRGTAARTPSAGVGAGLGLAIAQGLVTAHGGVLSVHDRGRGCRFTVRLPGV